MHVYRLGAEPEKYRPLTVARESDVRRLTDLHDRFVPKPWIPIPVEWLDEGDSASQPLVDFPTFGGVPAFSRRAVEQLRLLLESNGNILPLAMRNGDDFFSYQVTTIVDALDEDASDLARFSTGRIMDVHRYVFKPDAISTAIFKVPQLRPDIFVTEAFVEKVKNAGLTGFVFDHLYSAI